MLDHKPLGSNAAANLHNVDDVSLNHILAVFQVVLEQGTEEFNQKDRRNFRLRQKRGEEGEGGGRQELHQCAT